MLIIFDCDGVLVDSEKLAAQVFSDALKKIDVDMSPDVCFRTFHGKTLKACYEWLEDNEKISVPATFPASLERQTKEVFDLELQPVAGVDKVLFFLRRNHIRYCVASNGGHRKIMGSLGATGLLTHFPYRYSAQDVARGKPHPDLFLHAAQQMGEIPGSTIVIEDSITGYRAGRSAGMQVVVYDPDNKNEFADIDTYGSMTAVLGRLQSLTGCL